MKRLFLFTMALLFPWFILLIHDNPGGAFMALLLQASVIGWLPASMWALRLNRESRKSRATRP